MTLPQRKFLPHATPAWVRPGAAFFLTLCCVPRGANHLCHETVAGLLFEAAEFRHRAERWFVHLLLLMPDHLHGLVSFSAEEEMKKVIANFKGIAAKRAGIVWQRDFFDHRLRSDESFDEKARYIRMNPVRMGLVASPELWPYVWQPGADTAGPAAPPYL
jgi:putative transposase